MTKIIPTKTDSGCYAIGSGHSDAIVLVNPENREYADHRFVFAFGAYGWTKLMVWEDSLDDALETAAEWLAEHAPGHVMAHGSDEERALVREACEEAGIDPDDNDADAWIKAFDAAHADLTYTEAGWLTSYEWTIVAEDPSRADLIALVGGA